MTDVDLHASPWDHNAECRYCDEQGAHRADCPWLVALEAEVERLRGEKHEQFAALVNIRTLADRATGIDRSKGDPRESGALGAVKALVERYEQLRADAERERLARRVVDEALRTALDEVRELHAKLLIVVERR